MVDTIRSKATLQTLLADVASPTQLSEQAVRDFLVTALNGGTALTVADGGTIAHGCGVTPTVVSLCGTVANNVISVTTLDATSITVAIKLGSSGAAGTTQTIYWLAHA